MANIRIGCAGWDYKDWKGSFYPKKIEKLEHLEFYARYFDFVEINSTFYNIPSESAVIHWGACVSNSFQFSVKLWQDISHDLNNSDLESLVSQFFSRFTPLGDKIALFLIQFPARFQHSEIHEHLFKLLLNSFPSEYKFVFEFRHESWFDSDMLSKIFKKNNLIIGTTYLEGVKSYFHPNQDLYYIRLIGDRKLTKFDGIQRNQSLITNDLVKRIHQLNKSNIVKQIFIVVNNHYEGFSPDTVNKIKKKLQLPILSFSNQKKLEDFF
ncbi:MAG: DUF72 domain-containing protein [Candidatus Lokiarchaeota archaeon]|nr:DUF72 domain-containing protein [Candidatus Lokiarchaeota archaeon]